MAPEGVGASRGKEAVPRPRAWETVSLRADVYQRALSPRNTPRTRLPSASSSDVAHWYLCYGRTPSSADGRRGPRLTSHVEVFRGPPQKLLSGRSLGAGSSQNALTRSKGLLWPPGLRAFSLGGPMLVWY